MTQMHVAMAPHRHNGAEAHTNKRTPTAIDQAVGMKIRILRRAAGMTLRDLGEAVGVSCVQFQRYETGASRISASRLFAIGGVLGVRIDSLIAEPGSSNSEPTSRISRGENAELARLFKSISDPRHRLAIIGLARAIVAGEEHPHASASAYEITP